MSADLIFAVIPILVLIYLMTKVSPMPSVMACLILNSVPVSFGAVGTPTWFGFASLRLSPSELHAVAWKTAVIHSVTACVIPMMAFRLLLSWQEIRRNLLFIYLAIAASVVPMTLLALLTDEFPAVAGGMIGLLVTVWLTRWRVGLADDQSAAEETPVTSAYSVVKAMFPLWGTVLVLLATRIPQFGLRPLLTMASPVWEQMASYRFVQDTTDFVAAAEFLSRMADAKDVEGTSLGFMRLTMTCTNCHNHVRTASVAKLDETPERLKEELIASISGRENNQATDLLDLSTPQEEIRTGHHTSSEGQ